MSLATTKKHLLQILSDPNNKVVALSGKWGTGKSHLWSEVKADSGDKKIEQALYVSLFGLSSMDQVKLKIVQSAIPNADQNPTLWENMKKVWGASSKVLESVHKGFSAINEIALLAVPSLLKNRVIAIDDIERKHDKLSVDEVLGFVDEFTQQHGARIILILNSDELADPELWGAFREKVIDQEIRLDTTSKEAFDIASTIAPSPYVDRLRKTVETCGIVNIRIIRKVIRAVNRILGMRTDLSDDVLARLIPSTVLLSAIYYKGIDDGMDFDFVLGSGRTDWGNWGKKTEEPNDEDKQRAEWQRKPLKLGIYSCDEYEHLVVEYLKSGLFDVEEVSKIIERYASEAELARTQNLARQFHDHFIWHHWMSEAELLTEAQTLVKQAHLLDAYNITALHGLVSNLTGGQPVADKLVDHWVEAYHLTSHEEPGDLESFFHSPVHPRIKAAFDSAKATAQAKTTVFEACRDIVQKSGWGHKEEAIMKNATVQDFEATIKSLKAEDLRLFMFKFVDICAQPSAYKQHFGAASDHFIEACKNICADSSQRRLGDLIKMLFRDAKLNIELIEPAPTVDIANSSAFPAADGTPTEAGRADGSDASVQNGVR